MSGSESSKENSSRCRSTLRNDWARSGYSGTVPRWLVAARAEENSGAESGATKAVRLSPEPSTAGEVVAHIDRYPTKHRTYVVKRRGHLQEVADDEGNAEAGTGTRSAAKGQ